jgi:hypothetical protein
MIGPNQPCFNSAIGLDGIVGSPKKATAEPAIVMKPMMVESKSPLVGEISLTNLSENG